jgi:hypothetical protein
MILTLQTRHWTEGRKRLLKGCTPLDTMLAFYDKAPYNHDRNQDLDVPDLWLDL